MDISQVAKASGVPTSTLRYYEEKGLIHSIGRKGLKRVFPKGILETLSLISLGRSAGLSLDEIGNMVLPDGLNIDRALLVEKAEELDRKVQQMQVLSEQLKHVAHCNAPSHLECPNFQRLLKVATKQWRPAEKK